MASHIQPMTVPLVPLAVLRPLVGVYTFFFKSLDPALIWICQIEASQVQKVRMMKISKLS